jgi:hypothetical protein
MSKKKKKPSRKRHKAEPPPSFTPVVILGLVCVVLFLLGAAWSLQGTFTTLNHMRNQGEPTSITLVLSLVANTLIDVAIIFGGIGLIRRSERARKILVWALALNIVSLLWSGVNMARAMPIAAGLANPEMAEALQGKEGVFGAIFFIIGMLPVISFSAIVLVLSTRKFVTKNMLAPSPVTIGS